MNERQDLDILSRVALLDQVCQDRIFDYLLPSLLSKLYSEIEIAFSKSFYYNMPATIKALKKLMDDINGGIKLDEKISKKEEKDLRNNYKKELKRKKKFILNAFYFLKNFIDERNDFNGFYNLTLNRGMEYSDDSNDWSIYENAKFNFDSNRLREVIEFYIPEELRERTMIAGGCFTEYNKDDSTLSDNGKKVKKFLLDSQDIDVYIFVNKARVDEAKKTINSILVKCTTPYDISKMYNFSSSLVFYDKHSKFGNINLVFVADYYCRKAISYYITNFFDLSVCCIFYYYPDNAIYVHKKLFRKYSIITNALLAEIRKSKMNKRHSTEQEDDGERDEDEEFKFISESAIYALPTDFDCSVEEHLKKLSNIELTTSNIYFILDRLNWRYLKYYFKNCSNDKLKNVKCNHLYLLFIKDNIKTKNY